MSEVIEGYCYFAKEVEVASYLYARGFKLARTDLVDTKIVFVFSDPQRIAQAEVALLQQARREVFSRLRMITAVTIVT